MMDQPSPCSTLLFVEHVVLAFFQLVTACFTAFLVSRRIAADRREHVMKCPECREVERQVLERDRRRGWTKPIGRDKDT